MDKGVEKELHSSNDSFLMSNSYNSDMQQIHTWASWSWNLGVFLGIGRIGPPKHALYKYQTSQIRHWMWLIF